MIATLSDILFSSSAALEITLQPVGRGHSRGPTEQSLQLGVCIAAALPICMPRPPIEGGRQLSLGPGGVFLPESAENIARDARHGNRPKRPNILLVELKELPAGRQIIVDDIQHFAVD